MKKNRLEMNYSDMLRHETTGTDWLCAWQESCWIPPRRTIICCSSLLNFARFVPLLINYNLCPQKLTKNFLEIFMNANLSSKNRSVQPEIQLCAPVCFDGANIAFFA